jgi:hypothetical protein
MIARGFYSSWGMLLVSASLLGCSGAEWRQVEIDAAGARRSLDAASEVGHMIGRTIVTGKSDAAPGQPQTPHSK